MEYLKSGDKTTSTKIKVGDEVLWSDRSWSYKLTPEGVETAPYFINRQPDRVRVLVIGGQFPTNDSHRVSTIENINDCLVYNLRTEEYVTTQLQMLRKP